MNKQHPLYQQDLQRILLVPGIERLRGRHVLVTGATGLLGVTLIDALMALGDVKVTAVGRSNAHMRQRLGEHFGHPLFCTLEHDVRHPFADVPPVNYIIPLASNTHPKAYSEHPVDTLLTVTLGCQHALDLARRYHATLLYPSTVEVYGNARDAEAFAEDHTGLLNLATARAAYPEAKRTAEALCQAYAAEHGVDVRIARLSRIFGPTLLPTDTKASSQFIFKALAHDDIVLKSQGTQFFSYTYTADAVAALLHIMLHGAVATPYNIAAEGCNVRLRDFAALCALKAGTRVVIDAPDDTERRGYSIATTAILDAARLLATGWTPAYDIHDAIDRTLDILADSAPPA